MSIPHSSYIKILEVLVHAELSVFLLLLFVLGGDKSSEINFITCLLNFPILVNDIKRNLIESIMFLSRFLTINIRIKMSDVRPFNSF